METRSIRSKVRTLTNQKKDLITECEIYKSRQMSNYLRDMSKAICGDTCRAPDIILIGDGPDGETAYTDGDNIVINFESSLCRFFSTAESRFIAVMGMFFHEHAHVLYNEFGAEEQALKRLEKGLFYGDEPKATTKEEYDALIEMKEALANPLFAPVFAKIYHDLNNTVIDPHDEGKIMDEFGGLAVESIMKIVEALRASSVPLEVIEESVRNKRCSKLTAMYDLILDYIRFGRILCSDEQLERNSEFMKVLSSISSHVETARWTDDPCTRFSELNAIVFALWPFIQEELKKSQNQNNGQGQNSNDGQPQQSPQNGQNQNGAPNQQPQQGNDQQPTQEQIQQILQQLEQGAKKASQTHAPKGKTSQKAKENTQKAREGKQPAKMPGQLAKASQASKDALNAAFDQVANQLAQELAENELEREQADEIQRDAINRLSQTSSHRDIPIEIERITDVSDEDIAKYNQEMDELGLYSRRLQKQMLEIMRDLQRGGLNRHKAFGRIICPKDAYRPDELMFANKKQPIDLPNMAISILVDHSGSMRWNSRIEMSFRAAILLHDFASGIGVPVAVCGHRTKGKSVQYIIYTDFDRYSERDRYRLAKMNACGQNRDGAAIEISASRLEQRPEKLKLLIVISDGQPNHNNYSGEAAEEDIKSIVSRYRRKGVEIVGAAIGEDRDIIARIYGDGFLDITDLNTFPKILTKLVQKRLLSQIV